jgi:hypothetical protein
LERALPAPRRRDEPPRVRRLEPAPLAETATASKAGLGRTELVSTRPVAAFLAQYIDQHWNWPRSPDRKNEQRRRATGAYIEADMLPDLLSETLRPGHSERKL